MIIFTCQESTHIHTQNQYVLICAVGVQRVIKFLFCNAFLRGSFESKPKEPPASGAQNSCAILNQKHFVNTLSHDLKLSSLYLSVMRRDMGFFFLSFSSFQ